MARAARKWELVYKTVVTKDCLSCSEPFNTLKAEIKRGRGKYCSRSCRNKAIPVWNKGLTKADPRVAKYIRTGENAPNWQGGRTGENHRIRSSVEYKNWRAAVFKRDDYRCFDCGERGGDLEADHIWPFALFTRLRFDIMNGQTRCVNCHRKTPTWGLKLDKLKLLYGSRI